MGRKQKPGASPDNAFFSGWLGLVCPAPRYFLKTKLHSVMKIWFNKIQQSHQIGAVQDGGHCSFLYFSVSKLSRLFSTVIHYSSAEWIGSLWEQWEEERKGTRPNSICSLVQTHVACSSLIKEKRRARRENWRWRAMGHFHCSLHSPLSAMVNIFFQI